MELVARVVQDLGVTPEIAEAGVGAVLRMAAWRLARRSDQNASLYRVADAVPGFSDLTLRSPDFDPDASGGVAGWIGRQIGAVWADPRLDVWPGGALYPLTHAFAALGEPRPRVARLVEIVLDWFGETSGPEIEGLVRQALTRDGRPTSGA